MKYRKPVTHYDNEYLLTIFSANHYYYYAQFVGVISKRNRGPVLFETQCSSMEPCMSESNWID